MQIFAGDEDFIVQFLQPFDRTLGLTVLTSFWVLKPLQNACEHLSILSTCFWRFIFRQWILRDRAALTFSGWEALNQTRTPNLPKVTSYNFVL